MTRQKPIQIEVKKHGDHFAVHAEDQLVALAVYRKGALTVEALLRGLIHYSSRKFFRLALKDALAVKEADADQKPAQKPAAKERPAKAKAVKSGKAKPAKGVAAPASELKEQPTAPAPAEAPAPSAS